MEYHCVEYIYIHISISIFAEMMDSNDKPLQVPETDRAVGGTGGESEGRGREGDGRLRMERYCTSSLVVTYEGTQESEAVGSMLRV